MACWGNTELKGRPAPDRSLPRSRRQSLIDTANVYSDGVSESIIGEALTGWPPRPHADRHQGALPRWARGPTTGACRATTSSSSARPRLKRLKTDVIDLYQVHQWDGQTPLEETIEALDTLVKQGKVRYVGCSNYSAWHLMKALAIADAAHCQRFVSQQIHYTPARRARPSTS